MNTPLYACRQFSANTCIDWVLIEQNASLLDSLAISRDDAYLLSAAIISLMLLGWVGGFIGRILLKNAF